jgi:Flp pilus assembly protein CpaB
VLVARKPIPAWQRISDPESCFEIKRYPEDLAPRGALRDFASIKDQRLRIFLVAGQPVTSDDLVVIEENPLQIPEGHRATAIRIDYLASRDRGVLPGMRVDVISVTGKDKDTVLVKDVILLAVDSLDTVQERELAKPGAAITVTLSLSLEDGAKLALASAKEKSRLALRAR